VQPSESESDSESEEDHSAVIHLKQEVKKIKEIDKITHNAKV